MKIKTELRYFLLGSLIILLASCSSVDRQWRGSATVKLTSAERSLVLANAMRQKGAAYRFGGITPQQGLDCSGLIYYAYQTIGVNIPRSSNEQSYYFRGEKRPQTGDIVFFKINGKTVSHAGIYLGNNQMLHAPGSGRNVQVVPINNSYWKKRFYKFGRI